jgi:small-conductance mechanosensitive channel
VQQASFDQEDSQNGHDTQRMKRITQLEELLKDQTEKNNQLMTDNVMYHFVTILST